MTTPGAPVSHGRGGAGNIGVDELGNGTATSDVAGTGNGGTAAIQVHDDGIHSTGRGGVGNITDIPDPEPDATGVATQKPSAADDVSYHTGRGGAGNEHHAATTAANTTTTTTPADSTAAKKGKGIVAKLRAKVKQALTSLRSKKERAPRPEPTDVSAAQAQAT